MTAYCNKDIIELTYECSLEALEFKGDKLVKHFFSVLKVWNTYVGVRENEKRRICKSYRSVFGNIITGRHDRIFI